MLSGEVAPGCQTYQLASVGPPLSPVSRGPFQLSHDFHVRSPSRTRRLLLISIVALVPLRLRMESSRFASRGDDLHRTGSSLCHGMHLPYLLLLLHHLPPPDVRSLVLLDDFSSGCYSRCHDMTLSSYQNGERIGGGRQRIE